MSGSTDTGGKGAGVTAVTSAVALPFTGGHTVVTYVVLTALICGLVVLASKLVKQVAAR